ncbi:MAG: cysteine--tRNA ligase [Desulfobacterales bacterium]
MALRIYNTITGQKEVFEPLRPGKVDMYVCGPTVYDDCHIGHGRSAVVFDVVVRFLRAVGYSVTYVRNFTDVDDKIIRRANETGDSPFELAERFIEAFYRDMDALFVRRADIEPRVTEHIDDIVRLVESLIEKRFAYEIDGDVYFAVEKFADYGKLSGRRLEDMMAGARVEVDDRKQNPFDFALWKAAKPGEPSWPSPWGNGRPGWHIECSAMGRRHLGATFDIHGGGKDLIFPHHENEIAQSEAVNGQPLARFWLHNGFVNINKEKMSKSLGNFLMIKDILKQFHPETVRLFLLSSHYRSPIDFSDKAMQEADSAMERILKGFGRMEALFGDETPSTAETNGNGPLWERFVEAMEDDFNTAKALAEIFDAVHHANRVLDDDPVPRDDERNRLKTLYLDLRKCTRVLGLVNSDAESVMGARRELALGGESVDSEWIESRIRERAEARKARDFARADAIRDELLAKNILLEDRPEGTRWTITR